MMPIRANAATFISDQQFNDSSGKSLPPLAINSLTKPEEDLLLNKLKEFPKIPIYPYSGCHDRAHLIYLLTKNIAAQKIYKVWVLSPSLIAPALPGTIHYSADGWGQTNWRYHVAPVYRTADGKMMVLDAALNKFVVPMEISAWLSKFSIPATSVYTYTDAENYIFDTMKCPNKNCKVARLVFNGDFIKNSPGFQLRENHWVEKNLARDAVAEKLHNSANSCEWKNLLSKPTDLSNVLSKSSVSFPNECKPFLDLYKSQFQIWLELLKDK